jgi:hypothetical protein
VYVWPRVAVYVSGVNPLVTNQPLPDWTVVQRPGMGLPFGSTDTMVTCEFVLPYVAESVDDCVRVTVLVAAVVPSDHRVNTELENVLGSVTA